MSKEKLLPWQQDRDSQVFFSYLTFAHETVSKTFVTYFKSRYGLTPNQLNALCYLKPSQGLTMSVLASKMSVSKQQATQLVESLVKRGLVERGPSRESRRSVVVSPTAEGVALMEEGEGVYVNNAMDQMDRLEPQERQAMLEAMDLLARLLPRLNFHPQ